jgi:hypothetical protein
VSQVEAGFEGQFLFDPDMNNDEIKDEVTRPPLLFRRA